MNFEAELAKWEILKPNLLKSHPGQWVYILPTGEYGIYPTFAEAWTAGFQVGGVFVAEITDQEAWIHTSWQEKK